MTDAPFTETHRETLERRAIHSPSIRAALKEIDRLTKENEDMRKHLDGLFEIAHPEDGGA